MNIEFASAILFYAFQCSVQSTPPQNVNDIEGPKFELFDADANLIHDQFKESDMSPDALMKTAMNVGVSWFLVPGSTLKDSQEVLKLSEKYQPNVIATCGIHPYHAAADAYSDSSKSDLQRMINDPLCKAVGECGLDYSEGFPDSSFQKDWFRFHLKIACDIQKPLFLHSRQAQKDFINILNEYGFSVNNPPPVPGIVHCFTEEVDELQLYIDMGFYIGLTGYIINNPTKLQEYMRFIPLERLLVETDAPYMGFTGCRLTENKKKNARYPNVPAALPKVVTAISAVTGHSVSSIAQYTTRNALKLFRITR